MSKPIVISPEEASEVNQKIKELKETLEKHYNAIISTKR